MFEQCEQTADLMRLMKSPASVSFAPTATDRPTSVAQRKRQAAKGSSPLSMTSNNVNAEMSDHIGKTEGLDIPIWDYPALLGSVRLSDNSPTCRF